jgi:hypothetical protein
MVIQSIGALVGHSTITHDLLFVTEELASLFMWGLLSDGGTNMYCSLQLPLVLSSAVSLRFVSRGDQDYQFPGSPNLNGQFSVSLSPRN